MKSEGHLTSSAVNHQQHRAMSTPSGQEITPKRRVSSLACAIPKERTPKCTIAARSAQQEMNWDDAGSAEMSPSPIEVLCGGCCED